MKILFTLALALFFVVTPKHVQASDLMYTDTCAMGGDIPYHASLTLNQEELLYSSPKSLQGMISCEKAKQLKEALSMVNLALMPAMVVLNNPGVKAALLQQFLKVGVSAAATNPAVLGVTVIGASGYAVINIIMKKSVEDCERQEKEKLKQDIIRELRGTYQFSLNSSIQLTIGH